jgi:hypothetical protein
MQWSRRHVPPSAPALLLGKPEYLESDGCSTKSLMHARELVELAAIVAAHGPALIRGDEPIPAANVEEYWTASKVRLDRWARRLKQFVQPAHGNAPPRRPQWSEVGGVLEEILTGEVLTRVWTAVLCAHDRRRGDDQLEPVGRSVMIGHMEARHRVLTLMVNGTAIDSEAGIKLNHLRRRAERWTDLLLGRLMGTHDVGEFAFDPQRAGDFADDLRSRGGRADDRNAWPLMMTSLRAAFQPGLCPQSPNADLNARIASSILACFPADSFDSVGLLRSLWLMRLNNVADDTQVMIDDLLASESPRTGRESGASSDCQRVWRFREGQR